MAAENDSFAPVLVLGSTPEQLCLQADTNPTEIYGALVSNPYKEPILVTLYHTAGDAGDPTEATNSDIIYQGLVPARNSVRVDFSFGGVPIILNAAGEAIQGKARVADQVTVLLVGKTTAGT